MPEFHKCRSSSFRGGFESPLEQPCTSSVTLKLNEKGAGRSTLYFLLGARKKEGGTLYLVILKNNKKSDPIESLFCLVFVLLYCLPVCLTNVHLPPGI